MNLPASNRTSIFLQLLPLFSLLAFGLLTIPVWRWLWQEWMGNQYYSHGLLIPFVSIFLIVQRIRNDKNFPSRDSLVVSRTTRPIIALGICLLLYLLSLNYKAYFLAAFLMIGLIASLIWIAYGPSVLKTLQFPLAYLVLMVPLPFIDRITLPLAMFTGVCSGGLVQIMGLDIQIVGNAVQLPDANLVIGAQCSGINSLIALTAITALAAYLLNGKLWRKVILVLLALPLAILGNIMRVSTLLVVAKQYGVEAGFTFYHDYSGAIFFLVAMVLLYPLSRLLHFRTLRLEVI